MNNLKKFKFNKKINKVFKNRNNLIKIKFKFKIKIKIKNKI
jgi:hypothetical protein